MLLAWNKRLENAIHLPFSIRGFKFFCLYFIILNYCFLTEERDVAWELRFVPFDSLNRKWHFFLYKMPWACFFCLQKPITSCASGLLYIINLLGNASQKKFTWKSTNQELKKMCSTLVGSLTHIIIGTVEHLVANKFKVIWLTCLLIINLRIMIRFLILVCTIEDHT